MYRIGEFSILSKTTVKTLRYYEKEALLLPRKIDPNTGYRYYEASQLVELSKIISLRQIGISIKDIKEVLKGESLDKILNKRKKEIEKNLNLEHIQLSKINYLLEENHMNYQIILKELPACIVYYKEGIIKDYSELSKFILESGAECLELNPDIRCMEPDYCYVNYLDGEYKEKNIKVRYVQAVDKMGVENKKIQFMKIDAVPAVCIYHKGSYKDLRDSYNILMKYIEENHYEMIEHPRECYIDGCWNKEKEEDYLTEIQVPVKERY